MKNKVNKDKFNIQITPRWNQDQHLIKIGVHAKDF